MIVREEGLRGVYRGLFPVVSGLSPSVMSECRFLVLVSSAMDANLLVAYNFFAFWLSQLGFDFKSRSDQTLSRVRVGALRASFPAPQREVVRTNRANEVSECLSECS